MNRRALVAAVLATLTLAGWVAPITAAGLGATDGQQVVVDQPLADTATTSEPLNVTVSPVTEINETTATVSANVTGLGGAENATVYVKYWPSGEKENATTTEGQTCTSPCAFKTNLTGLTPGESYGVQVNVDNGTTTVFDETYFRAHNAGDIRATLLFPNGTPAAGRFVWATPQVGQGNRIGSDYTGPNGSLHVEDVMVGAEYEVAYFELFDGNGTTRNGVPDVYVLLNGDLEDETDLGTVRLPEAYVVNTTVLDHRGDGVKGARVTYDHKREKGLGVSTNAAGMAQAGSFPVGLEVVGNVTMVVRPPDDDRFVDRQYVRNITVSSRRNLTFRLNPVVNVTTSEATVVNETAVTFDADLGSAHNTSHVRVHVQYWQEGRRNATLASAPVHNETGPANYSETVSGLETGETYVYRAVAANDEGVVVNGTNATVTVSVSRVDQIAADGVSTAELRESVSLWIGGDISTSGLRRLIHLWVVGG